MPPGGDPDPGKPPLLERLKAALLKPAKPGEVPPAPAAPKTVAELEAIEKRADDRERAIGLVAAPLGALIGILVISNLVDHNKLHVGASIYTELLLVLLGLSVLMLVFAWFRKRLFLGIVLALYGLAIFNLHYWGFGVPFILAGAWYLVTAYRAQRAVKEAREAHPDGTLGDGKGGTAPPPSANKRYTPKSPAPKRSVPPKSDPKSDRERRAG